MQATHLLQLNNPPKHNHQHLKYKSLSKKLLTMLKLSMHLSKNKNSKLITISEWLTYKIREDT